MKSLITLASLCVLAGTALAQPNKSEDRYFEGVNLSFGAATAQSKTNGASANSGFAQAKVNYTFALSHPVKLGLTATADLGNARLSATETWAAGNLSEVSLEPGILLISNGLLYAKIGTHRGQYETAGATRSFSGSAERSTAFTCANHACSCGPIAPRRKVSLPCQASIASRRSSAPEPDWASIATSSENLALSPAHAHAAKKIYAACLTPSLGYANAPPNWPAP